MKTIMLSFIVFLSATSMATPSENTFAAVTNDWYAANFTNVYELAVSRRSANTNDVVAAYLLFDWNVCFESLQSVSDSVSRVIELSDRVTNSTFKSSYDQLRESFISYRDELLPTVSESARQAERYKSFLPHKDMPSVYMLWLLDEAGLW